MNIPVVQLDNHRDPSRREATRDPSRGEATTGLISPDDQFCCTQASQGECVAQGYHPPADVSSSGQAEFIPSEILPVGVLLFLCTEVWTGRIRSFRNSACWRVAVFLYGSLTGRIRSTPAVFHYSPQGSSRKHEQKIYSEYFCLDLA